MKLFIAVALLVCSATAARAQGVWMGDGAAQGATTGVLQIERTPGGGHLFRFADRITGVPEITCLGTAASATHAELLCDDHVAEVRRRGSLLVVRAGRTFRLRRTQALTALAIPYVADLRRSNLRTSDGRTWLQTLGPDPTRMVRTLAAQLRPLYAGSGAPPLTLDDADELFRIAHLTLLERCQALPGLATTARRCSADEVHRQLAAAVQAFVTGRQEDDQR